MFFFQFSCETSIKFYHFFLHVVCSLCISLIFQTKKSWINNAYEKVENNFRKLFEALKLKPRKILDSLKYFCRLRKITLKIVGSDLKIFLTINIFCHIEHLICFNKRCGSLLVLKEDNIAINQHFLRVFDFVKFPTFMFCIEKNC